MHPAGDPESVELEGLVHDLQPNMPAAVAGLNLLLPGYAVRPLVTSGGC
jgi:hypothetical protein